MRVRGDERFGSDLATVARLPATGIALSVVDVSHTGCRIRADSELARVGATIIITISDLADVSGEIVWAEGGYCGVRFHTPISDELVDQIANDIV